ncbi:helix-turn-helix domain-containing protein [Radiobacillus deserti]|uniref:Helix-turn-helix domain-containing protein n=1 Tax=Radiobacillus deserti TaxID=2594883 RepID=A0A516KDK3_9BACI|nr:helix-turn-helix transcriptional regulator [Radiobacillus deserti]QDP39485.1 helix-turn-helix domain-containing protein [Radiobacillus deserti]
MNKNQLGYKLKYKRKQLSYTQEQVCLGICSKSYLSKIENNKILGKPDIMELLCERLELDIEDIYINQERGRNELSELEDIYKAINNKNFNNFKKQYKIINSHLDKGDPIISLACEIILLEYHTAQKEKELSSSYAEKVKNKYEYLPDEFIENYYKSLGYYEYTYGDLERSLDYLYEAEKVIKKKRKEDSNLHYLLAIVNTKFMLTSLSIIHTEKALNLYDKELNIKQIINCKLLLGINYIRIEKYDLAENIFMSIIDSLKGYSDKRILSKTYHNLGYVYLLTKRHHISIEFLNMSLILKTSREDKLSTIYLLAYEYKLIGNKKKALELCKEGLKYNRNNSFSYKLLILRESISPKMHLNEFQKKLENEILPYFLKKDPFVAAECYSLLASLYIKENKYKSATIHLQNSIDISYKFKNKQLLM